ncbi:LPS sulfotransferase NodH [Pseudorhodobacter antarcticus]|uniref:LPS sulfotransferase NodH n=1 Tax=Pseudorhodobacter antarcticus TaxID=1077947 RepID=A0A1H8KUA9_9RHOB|nr:Stf0 family sulfotransferase [Pseudorhodobacter antarcticus]SEN96455.1 LPS sulfotransferase NodH [Pseudorhodobacter antarcticus]
MKRFVVLGLPRSGTTYLVKLLNSHSQVFCSGEQFNPHAIVHTDHTDQDYTAFLNRDKAPLAFVDHFFAQAAKTRVACAGFKFMIGHNIDVLKQFEHDPDLVFIHLWRENKLAQISSLLKARDSLKWAQTKHDPHINAKIRAKPKDISEKMHEYATYDHLIALWLQNLPNQNISVEYKDLFQPHFIARICGFLGVAPEKTMKSPLVKQSDNKIANRFVHPEPILYYFTQIGKAHWLTEEL